MDIGSIIDRSVMNSQNQLMQAVQISVAKMAMDQTEQVSDAMVKMMEQSVTPHIGANLDISL